MKEKLLVLAKAYPVVSQKYAHLVCVAGITDKGEWRRIYPVPFQRFFYGNGFPIKHWIEYELEDDKPSDHRPESRKVKLNSFRDLNEEPYANIHKMLEQKVTSIEDLTSAGHRNVSLGVIKPNVLDFYPIANQDYSEMIRKSKQQTLDGTSAIKIFIPESKFRYKFKCGGSCVKEHNCLCEDWGMMELYRKYVQHKGSDKPLTNDEIMNKVKEHMFDWMKTRKELYFIVGTHYRFNTFMVIGIIHPRKDDTF